jgi:hypothetical protein
VSLITKTKLGLSARMEMRIVLQDITFLFSGCFILQVTLPLDLVKSHHTVSSHSFFFIQNLRDAQYKKDQVGEEALQFLLPNRELANTFSIERHGKHYGLLIRYMGARYDKQ